MNRGMIGRLAPAIVLASLMSLFLAAPAFAQQSNDEVDYLGMEMLGLEAKADEVVKVSLWGRSLEQGKKLLSLRKNVTGPMQGFLGGLKGVYRRTYRFGRNKPEQADIEPIYQQLADDGWVPLIETQDRRTPESVSVYSYYENEEVAGVTVVSTDSEEVTVVKILGPIDLKSLSEIGDGMGLPIMNVASRELTKQKEAAPKPE